LLYFEKIDIGFEEEKMLNEKEIDRKEKSLVNKENKGFE
jgi:hypothetical protein